MSPEEKAKLVREYERLRRSANELNVQVNYLDQVLAAMTMTPPELRGTTASLPRDWRPSWKPSFPQSEKRSGWN